MGWLYYFRAPGASDVEHFRSALSTGQYELLDGMTVRAEAGSGYQAVFYAAVHDKRTDAVECFVALINRGRSRHPGDANFGYKDMDERMGPAERDCPRRILELLSPLPTCEHVENYCRLCCAQIARDELGQWSSEAKPGQVPEVAGPRCYSGYPSGMAGPNGERPYHEPGGTAPCGTCWAREWRADCWANVAKREARPKAKAGDTLRFAKPIEFTNGERADELVLADGRRNQFVRPGGIYRYTVSRWRERDFEIVAV